LAKSLVSTKGHGAGATSQLVNQALLLMELRLLQANS